jgi:hypothetical protein
MPPRARSSFVVILFDGRACLDLAAPRLFNHFAHIHKTIGKIVENVLFWLRSRKSATILSPSAIDFRAARNSGSTPAELFEKLLVVET